MTPTQRPTLPLLALALLGACALLSRAAAAPACVIDLAFVTGPQTAALTLGGEVVEPVPVPIRHTTVAGVAGNTSLVFYGPCPTALGLAAALPNARLKPVEPSGFKIALMEARIASLASISIIGFRGVFESPTALTARDGTSPFRVRAIGGIVRIVGRRGGVTDVPLAPETMAGQGCGITANSLGQVSLRCPSVVLYRRLDVKDDGNQVVDIEVRGILTANGKLSDAREVDL